MTRYRALIEALSSVAFDLDLKPLGSNCCAEDEDANGDEESSDSDIKNNKVDPRNMAFQDYGFSHVANLWARLRWQRRFHEGEMDFTVLRLRSSLCEFSHANGRVSRNA